MDVEFIHQQLLARGYSRSQISMALKMLQNEAAVGALRAAQAMSGLNTPNMGVPIPQLVGMALSDPHGPLALTFDDVSMGHQFSETATTLDASAKTIFARDIELPGGFIVGSPMTHCWFGLCRALADAGVIGCVHRMPIDIWWGDPNDREVQERIRRLNSDEVEAQIIRKTVEGFDKFLRDGYRPNQIVVSVSLRTYQKGHVDQLWEVAQQYGQLCILIETANGATRQAHDATRKMRKRYGQGINIGAGNFSSDTAVVEFAEAGGDWVRGPQGAGRVCTTRRVLGIGIPSLTWIARSAWKLEEKGLLFRKSGKGVTICQDGGTTGPGDRIKALCAGADSSMAGSSLAPVKESDAQLIEDWDGNRVSYFKVVSGSASAGVVRSVRKEDYHRIAVEGGAKKFPVSPRDMMTVKEWMAQTTGAFRQAAAYYHGARSIEELRARHWAVRVTPAGDREGHAGVADGTSKVSHF